MPILQAGHKAWPEINIQPGRSADPARGGGVGCARLARL